MIVSTNQPYFAPYPGFFYKARLSDCLVILDEVQFPRRTTWITRNRFKNDQGTLWMTIPVRKKGLGPQKISEVRICHQENWRKKHRRSFHQAYAHAPYLAEHIGILEQVLSPDYERILDVDLAVTDYVMEYLGVETRRVLLSELGGCGTGQELIVNICKALGADRFLVQASALAYYDPAQLAAAGIELVSFKKPEWIYPQMWGDFIENLSVMDMLFTCGPKSREIIFRPDSRESGGAPARPTH